MSVKMAFMLGIISACLQIIAVASSWVQGTIAGRRKLYLIGTAINIGLCLILGIVACLPRTHATSYAQAALGMCITLVMSGVIGPVSFTIIAETSSVRLRGLSTAFGRGMYYVANFPTIFCGSSESAPADGKCHRRCSIPLDGTWEASAGLSGPVPPPWCGSSPISGFQRCATGLIERLTFSSIATLQLEGSRRR